MHSLVNEQDNQNEEHTAAQINPSVGQAYLQVEVSELTSRSLASSECDVDDAKDIQDKNQPGQAGFQHVPDLALETLSREGPHKSNEGADRSDRNGELKALALILRGVGIVVAIPVVILTNRRDHDNETGHGDTGPGKELIAAELQAFRQVSKENVEGHDEGTPAEEVEIGVADPRSIFRNRQVVVRVHDRGQASGPKDAGKKGLSSNNKQQEKVNRELSVRERLDIVREACSHSERTYHASFHRSVHKLVLEAQEGQHGQARKSQRNADGRDGPLGLLGLVRDVTFFSTFVAKLGSDGDQGDGRKGGDHPPVRVAIRHDDDGDRSCEMLTVISWMESSVAKVETVLLLLLL